MIPDLITQNLWILLALLGGLFQTIRNTSSRTVAKIYKPSTVTLIRFGYALPFGLTYTLILYLMGFVAGVPTFSFFLFTIVGSVFQAIGNTLFVNATKYGNFAVVVSFFRTDAILIAILSTLIFNVQYSTIAIFGIFLTVFGTFLITFFKNKLKLSNLWSKDVVFGVSSAFFMAIAIMFFAESNKSFVGGNLVANVSIALIGNLFFQTILNGLWVFWKQKNELLELKKTWKNDIIIGLASALATICWFMAYVLKDSALVRAVGQIEFLFSILVSVYFFKEKLKKVEILSILIICVGILLVGLFR